MKEKFVNAKGVRTRYLEGGKGDEVLVLVHGGQYGSLYSADSWDLNIEELSRKFHVIALDKIGMGYTDNPCDDAGYTIDSMVEHFYDFLDAVGLSTIHLVGHSRGAYLAARVSIESPHAVKTLVMVDSNTAAREDSSFPSGEFYDRLQERIPSGPPTRESVKIEPVAQSFSPSHVSEEYVSKILRIALLPKSLEVRERMRRLKKSLFIPHLNKRRAELIEQIETAGIRPRTLIIWGANDPSAPLPLAFDLYETVRKKTDDTQLHIFNHAGHYSFREHPKEFNTLLANFCR